MSKPKGKTPSLIGGTLGKPKTAETKAASKCNRCGETIPKDTACFEIPQLNAPFANSKRYCDECMESILKKTHEDLVSLFNLAGVAMPIAED